MSLTAPRDRSPSRQVALSLLALVVVVLPDATFTIVAEAPWEVFILRWLGLVGVSLLAVLPWASKADSDVRRTLRRWSIPGVAASAVYLMSADPIYLILGFCLLVGATVSAWMNRAHLASETLRIRLISRDNRRRR